jgi:N-acetylneuraminate synthase/N,N'-diacetyllegionaminate synthase
MEPSRSQSKRLLFLVVAGGGSKRQPDNNLLELAGIPLVGHAVRRALEAGEALGMPFVVACSTDDESIASTALTWGAVVPFRRPAHLGSDTPTQADVALHALDWFEAHGETFDILALVQPTSPLAPSSGLVAVVRSMLDGDASSAVAVSPSHADGWNYLLRAGRLEPAGPSVEGDTYTVNGSAYAVTPASLRATHTFVEPGASIGVVTSPSLDIDNAEDLTLAEAVVARRRSHPVVLGGRGIGSGNPSFIIAEAGVNHNGDVALAHRLIDAAAGARVDAVKFQTFDPDLLAASGAPTAEYQRRADETMHTQRDLLRGLVLGRDVHLELKAHAEAAGLIFLSSPFDYASADFLEQLGVPAFKIPSGEITNLPFIEHVARKGRPMLVSTGMSDMVEIAAAVDRIRAAGLKDFALFHCVSNYPASPESCNLRAMATLRAAFGQPVGWSDHTAGWNVTVAAAALGAELIEKHLTLDRNLPGPDQAASLEPDEFRILVEAVRAAEAALGSAEKRPTPDESATAAVARKSLHWRVARKTGDLVEADDFVAMRPGTGLSPGQGALLTGQRVVRSVTAGSIVELGDIEPQTGETRGGG